MTPTPSDAQPVAWRVTDDPATKAAVAAVAAEMEANGLEHDRAAEFIAVAAIDAYLSAQPFAERLGNGKELPVSGNVLPEPAAWRWKAPRWPEGKWALSDSQGEVDAMRSWAIFEPLYPQSALDVQRQKREAAERDVEELRGKLDACNEHARVVRHERDWAQEVDVKAAEDRAEAAEASLARANATIERLTAEGLYISEQFSGAAGDIVKLRARIAELEAALRGLHSAVSDMRVPQTIEEAGAQITLSIGPAFVAAGKALTNIEKERDDD